MKQTSTRAGVFQTQSSGYSAFVPARLIPIPQLAWDEELGNLLADAGVGVGRLDGLTRGLPNPDLFISIFVRQEAVLSAQIEGTQCTLEDVLNFPVPSDKKTKEKEKEVQTVINYVEAMNYGLQRLNDADGLPLSMRLLREIHRVLMDGVRGQNRDPGEVRRTQNWIGPAGSTIMTASYVPPPVPEMHEALTDLERFLHVRTGIPPLVQVALAHAQFETIHPFLDGNGRLGRLLIALFLCERKLLKRPLLYLSHYLKSNQYEYYNRLTAVREDGNWEEWLKFFLRGVRIVSDQAIRNAELLLELREEHRRQISRTISSIQAMTLLDYLCDQPIVTVQMVSHHLECSYITAQRLIEDFEKGELLKEVTGQKRNKRYEYEPYLRFWKGAQDDYGSIRATHSGEGRVEVSLAPDKKQQE
jgi:Fic family protein